MEQIITFAGILSAITIALTEVIKRTNTIPKNIIPLISIVIGVVIGGITNYIPELVSELSLSGHLLAGLISGLMATGIWETFKNKEGTTKDNKGELVKLTPNKKPENFDTTQPFTDDADEVYFDVNEYENNENSVLGSSEYHEDKIMKVSDDNDSKINS